MVLLGLLLPRQAQHTAAPKSPRSTNCSSTGALEPASVTIQRDVQRSPASTSRHGGCENLARPCNRRGFVPSPENLQIAEHFAVEGQVEEAGNWPVAGKKHRMRQSSDEGSPGPRRYEARHRAGRRGDFCVAHLPVGPWLGPFIRVGVIPGWPPLIRSQSCRGVSRGSQADTSQKGTRRSHEGATIDVAGCKVGRWRWEAQVTKVRAEKSLGVWAGAGGALLSLSLTADTCFLGGYVEDVGHRVVSAVLVAHG